jgi:hypothetical protein
VGLGTPCARTYVTRCLVGDPGTTYKYLGLRMFAHPWNTDGSPAFVIQELNSLLTKRTQHHLRQLNDQRDYGAQGRAAFDICLINRMQDNKRIKPMPNSKDSRCAVSWHADSSLEHYSSIAVYHTLLLDDVKAGTSRRDWEIALRVAHHSEGPRRGTDQAATSASVDTAPTVAVSLPSGSAYYLLDDFNHHHQHAVMVGDGVRYSCTHRLLRSSHNVADMLARCQSACAGFHKRGPKIWRSEQLLLTELETEWLRQFYIQGQQHHDVLWQSWGDPIQELLKFWSQLEMRTKQTIDLLCLGAEGRCETSVEATTRKDRKLRDKRRKACAVLDDLVTRGNSSDNDTLFEPFAAILEERATMRELWAKRERDAAFRDMGPELQPMKFPAEFDVDEGTAKDRGSPLPLVLRQIVKSLHAHEKTYRTRRMEHIIGCEYAQRAEELPSERNHSVTLSWPEWSEHQFGLEMQSPWASMVLDGRKTIETRAYDLPPALLGKRILIIETPNGKAGVSAIGQSINFSKSDARVVGWCKFSSVVRYSTRKDFEADEQAHLVRRDSGYGWKDGTTKVVYGWVVGQCGTGQVSSFQSAERRMRSLFELLLKGNGEVVGTESGQKRNNQRATSPKKKRKRY